jgi:Na+-transporting NADH:ubiquinone oxidoreductase subunit D
MAEKSNAIIKRTLFSDNQVLRGILGICSSLAITNTMKNSLVMGLGLSFVTALSSLTLSAMRNIIPHRVRMLVHHYQLHHHGPRGGLCPKESAHPCRA